MRKPAFFAYAKTKMQISFTVTAKLISAFVFAIRIVQSLCYEMDKTSIFMFEILEPGGSALGKYSI